MLLGALGDLPGRQERRPEGLVRDGPEDAADWIREVKQKAMSRPLIVISGEAPDAMVEEFSASGDIMATLTKPFELVFLKDLLKRAVEESA